MSLHAEELPYHTIPDPPEVVSGTCVLVRMLDGLGFRYRWATEGLRESDAAFRPGSGSMTLLELLRHVCRLTSWVTENLGAGPAVSGSAAPLPPDAAADDLEGLRRQTLTQIGLMRVRLLAMDDADLARLQIAHSKGAVPFWNMLNGPLADALTHVGQINAWRRLAGNPAPRADVFRGRPPG